MKLKHMAVVKAAEGTHGMTLFQAFLALDTLRLRHYCGRTVD